MYLTDYIKFDGLRIAELIRNKEIKQDEAISCALEAAELLNPKINSLLEVFPEPLAGNESIEAPFFGVPFLIKDLALHAEGVLNEMGSRLAQGLRTQHDAGIRIEPPPSLACAKGTIPAATEAALAPLEPPGMRVRSQGLHVGPLTTGSVVGQ